MAWGYWSATSVGDRGRSPRRDKDKAIHHQLQQQPQQYQTLDSLQGSSTLQVQGELEASGVGGGGGVGDDPPSSRMIQGGSFYSYSAAAAAVAAAAERRTLPANLDGPSSGIHVFPRDIQQPRPGTSNFSPSPGSDSAEYEQPIHLNSYIHHDDPRDVLVQTSSRIKLLRDDGDDDISETEFEDMSSADVIYASNNRLLRPGSSGCLVHGPYPSNETGHSLPSFVTEHGGSSASQFWFNDITWGMFFHL